MLKIRNRKWASFVGALSSVALLHGDLVHAETVSFSLETATLDDVRKALDSGNLSSVELTAMYLNRRSVYDQSGVKLNAVVQINPALFEEAAAADLRRKQHEQIGPLDGIPFVTKDSYNSVGVATTGGMSLWKDIYPTTDNFVVSKLKAAGAVLIGHANMDTFANSATSTVSDAFGTTLNAYTLGVPAGSSGGPAVATGADFAFFGFGGETGGSIRNPSDRAGIVGFKVGVGTISVDGVLALVPDRDVIGPMARYTKDNAAIMDVATQVNSDDIWSTVDYIPSRARSSDYVTKQEEATLAGKKLGVIRTYVGQTYPSPTPSPSTSNTTGTTSISTEILSIFNRAKSELQAEGATIEEVYLPADLNTAVSLGDGHPTRALVTPTTNATYLQAWSHINFLTALGQDTYTRLSQVPGTRISAALLTAVQNNTTLSFTSTEGVEHFSAQQEYVEKFEAWMESNGFDALIWPVHTAKTRTSATVPGRDLVNNMGLPLCTVPMGVIPSTGEPSTLGFLGRYKQEADILALAHAYELATNYRIPSPLAPPLEDEVFDYEVADDGSVPAVPEAGSDVTPPVLSIASTAEIQQIDGESKLVLTGTAAEANGLSELRVYVNGRRVSSAPAAEWTSSAAVTDVQSWIDPGTTAVDVLVLAKDSAGNASATFKTLDLPTGF